VSAYSDLILGTAGLISYWRLGEVNNTDPVVDSKDGNNGTANGNALRQAVGLLTADNDTAAHGDGVTGSYLRIPRTANMNVGAKLSVEAWVKIDVYKSAKLVSRDGPGWYFSMSGSTSLRFGVRDTNFVDTLIDAVGYLIPGVRIHLVGTYDAAGAMKFYVNGVSVGAPSRTPNANVLDSGSGIISMFSESNFHTAAQCTIDEVSFYNTVLSPAQVQAHFDTGRGAFDSCTGSIGLSGTCDDRYVLPGWLSPRIRERPPLRHMIDAMTPGGLHYRWAGDEHRAENVFSGLRWSSTMPGGHENTDLVLTRLPDVVYNDLERFTTLKIISAGGNVVGEFRLERTPQTSGDQMAISPSAVGWQAHLDDNKTVSIVFIDRELGNWGEPSRARFLILDAANYTVVGGGTVMPDPTSGVPTLEIGFDDPGGWTAANRPIVEPLYDAGAGNFLGRLRANWSVTGITLTDAVWSLVALLASTDSLGVNDQSPDQLAGVAGVSSGTFDVAATAPRRFASLELTYANASVATGVNVHYGCVITNLRVFGNHGLPIRGSTPQTEGFFASDIVKYAVSKFAPLLKITPDSFQATNFIIPQSAFRDGTTVSEIVKQSTRFGLEDWWVGNDKTFYLHPRGLNPLARRWRLRIGPAKLEQTGKQADRLWESIVVQFNDVDGSTKTVGPPGSGCDVESVYLRDSDPDNPANRLNITRRDKLIMGTSTAEGAIEVGRRFLEEQKALDRSGRAVIVGHAEDDHGVIWPYSEVKAGDLATFIDAADVSYRRIVKADHDEATKTATIDLDAPPEGLEAVLERLGVVLVPLGL
jgi:hypothetical protein